MKKFLIFIIILYVFSVYIPYFANRFTNNHTKLPDNHIRLYDTEKNKVTSLPFEEYLYYVIAAEIPASFHIEAIKAQTICARTYSYKKMQSITHSNGADLCTDINHCQSYTTESNLKKLWKENYTYYKDKINNAIKETKDMIITYNNKPIDALYHSSNNGYTENSEDVWKSSLPYLRSVKSPDENSPDFNYIYHISSDDLYSQIKEKYKNAKRSSGIGKITYTKGGNVKNINLYSIDIKGVELRTLLSLKSASFDMEESENTVKITTHGYGHGVGLSQYGANEMAHQGKNYQEIINHYYKGTNISKKE